jgi:hypothetical protein
LATAVLLLLLLLLLLPHRLPQSLQKQTGIVRKRTYAWPAGKATLE